MRRSTRNRLVKALIVVLVVGLPVIASWIYRGWTTPPDELVIAGGPAGGQYDLVARELARSVASELETQVRVIETEGSLENLQLLEAGEVDFAMFQQNALAIPSDAGDVSALQDHSRAAFVANLYSEVTHVIAREGVSLATPEDWRGKRIAVGRPGSGDHSMTQILLEHLGLGPDEFTPVNASYNGIVEGIEAGEIDVAILTAGLRAPVLRRLLAPPEGPSTCELVGIPFVEAFTTKYMALSSHTIPRGLYATPRRIEPSHPLETVSVRAQFITRVDVPTTVVEAVTRIVHDADFQRRASLAELHNGGERFSRQPAQFSLHPGALHIYEPGLKPLLNSDFVEATEGIRSFVVSMLISFYLLFRWWRDHLRRKTEHKLDRYIHQALDIERRQLDYDVSPGRNDTAVLQRLLDQVTRLRQAALAEFDAHELNEDRAIDCFLEMCHALSDKINAKLTRQRLELGLRTLAETQRTQNSATGHSGLEAVPPDTQSPESGGS
ncbi:NMT1/THI5 like protein [Maioricimonas rarisocia]|uniref:NMT1/THI5 like protein n=1 Tax=Maioricimonas rarisocia TaxID=2528026 RepID=A0A517Z563_9PLAN|nr:TAXI family TRAP transporter solute-binding subunit [Maioricimonas rarisocia]QDU37587.1 NMT1/THI5 like protein [Maioricimonas rarisocia]